MQTVMVYCNMKRIKKNRYIYIYIYKQLAISQSAQIAPIVLIAS